MLSNTEKKRTFFLETKIYRCSVLHRGLFYLCLVLACILQISIKFSGDKIYILVFYFFHKKFPQIWKIKNTNFITLHFCMWELWHGFPWVKTKLLSGCVHFWLSEGFRGESIFSAHWSCCKSLVLDSWRIESPTFFLSVCWGLFQAFRDHPYCLIRGPCLHCQNQQQWMEFRSLSHT